MSKALSFAFLFVATGLLVLQLFVGNYIIMDLTAAILIIIAILRIEKLQKEASIAKEKVIKRQREIYNVTHDKLTGLYTKEILFHKIKDTISQNTDKQYWVAYFDIKDFKIVNDIFGNDMGDSVLLKVASWLRENSTREWVYGRLGGDDFGICLPAGDANLKQLERRFSRYVISNGSIEHRILMHMGIYKITEPDIDVSLMFDRAQLALTSVKNEYNKHIAFYDDKMRDQVMWDQMISAQIEKAIEERQVAPTCNPL